MNSKKLLKTLDKFFNKEQRKLRKHHDELAKLLLKLDEKEGRLLEKIRSEGDQHKLERLEQKLAIIKAQHDKGTKALAALETALNEP